MLRRLEIQDLAIIDTLHLEFEPGLNMFTGATGAGKSILVEAIGLLLGDRADADLIRDGAEQSTLYADLELEPTHELWTTLAQTHAADSTPPELVIRRQIRRNGRSRVWLNTAPVNLRTLRDLSQSLIDIHSQHAHQSLLRMHRQRQILDSYGVPSTLLEALRQQSEHWHQADRKLREQEVDVSASELELLGYQLEELEAQQLSAGEYERLLDKHRTLSHARQVLEAIGDTLAALQEEEPAISTRLHQMQRQINAVCDYEPGLKNILVLLKDATVPLDEACMELRHLLQHEKPDPAMLAAVEQRLDVWHTLARKHRVSEQELYSHQQRLRQRLDRLQHTRDARQALQRDRAAAHQRWQQLAQQLHKERNQCAKRFSAAVSDWMQRLGMSGGAFQVAVEAMADDDTPHPEGCDQVQFLVSTNPGQAMRPLHKVASGGELSRISLAIRIIASADRGIPILIYDEVDAGVGADIAGTIGELLAELAEHHQVLCISHHASIAARAGHHYRISKAQQNGKTFVAAQCLSPEQRVQELARMIGGHADDHQAQAHARGLLQNRNPGVL